jgi:uncharacterized membrane protein YGL010W
MRTLNDWLAEYGVSHCNPVNKCLHWVCVPLIMLAALGLLWSIDAPAGLIRRMPALNWASIAAVLTLGYYTMLSPRLALGMLPILAFMLIGVAGLATLPVPLWQTCLAIFAVAWVGQFVGHAIEDQRPSFLKDTQFLLIGPLWLLGFVYRRIGRRY